MRTQLLVLQPAGQGAGQAVQAAWSHQPAACWSSIPASSRNGSRSDALSRTRGRPRAAPGPLALALALALALPVLALPVLVLWCICWAASTALAACARPHNRPAVQGAFY
jgi:hypothetical protein